MPTVYRGNKPFVFISYAHKDTAWVMPIVDALAAKGIRIWYDAGIEAGSEWPEYIATHLKSCGCVLFFISQNYDSSDNCRRELTYALNHKKPSMSVYLDPCQLSDGLELQLGLVQAMFLNHFPTAERLAENLASVPMVAGCHTDADDVKEDHTKPIVLALRKKSADLAPEKEKEKHIAVKKERIKSGCEVAEQKLQEEQGSIKQEQSIQKYDVANILLISIWLTSVAFLLWTLRNVPLYIPHLIEKSPWIYCSLVTGWCVPLIALWGKKKEQHTILGVSIRLICKGACVIQSVLMLCSVLFTVLQSGFIRLIPGGVILGDTYFVGKHRNEWMPFVICLLAYILLIAKDSIAFLIATKTSVSEKDNEVQ